MLEERLLDALVRERTHLSDEVAQLENTLSRLQAQNSRRLDEVLRPSPMVESSAPILPAASDWATSYLVMALLTLREDIRELQDEASRIQKKEEIVPSDLAQRVADLRQRESELREQNAALKDEFNHNKCDLEKETQDLRLFITQNARYSGLLL